GIDDLVLYHIAGIDSRYCDDLKTFWKEVTKLRNEEGYVRPMTDFKKVPEDKGWIIEIQGFTYHRGRDKFIRETLLTNLARRGIREVPAAAPAPAKGPSPRPGPAVPPPAGAPAV